VAKFPAITQEYIYNYGLRQILNDAMASAKEEDGAANARAMAEKRLDNMYAGTLRASPVREGDPIRARALELAGNAVAKAPAFIKAIQAQGWKLSDKRAVALRRSEAVKQLEIEGNPFIAQAKIDVEGAKALTIGELVIDI
jgi:hypothetical protein